MSEYFDKNTASVRDEYPKCCAGCKMYDHHEAVHLKECPNYPETLTKINDDKIRLRDEAIRDLVAGLLVLKDHASEEYEKLGIECLITKHKPLLEEIGE